MSSVQPSLPPTPAPSTHSSHSTRRETQSSTHSRTSSRSQPHPAVESAVTRLLVAIKQLLEALTLWSTMKMSETQVSDVYVRLGNDFNAAVAAFGQFNIDMSELTAVPDDLRSVLEQCLSEDATVENLDLYLPSVRKIITTLLQGLRNKQSIYRRMVSDRRHRSDTQGHERTDSRSSKTSKSESIGAGPSRAHLPRNGTEAESGATRGSAGDGHSRKRAPSTSRRREQPSQPSVREPMPTEGEGYFPGGFAAQRTAVPDERTRQPHPDTHPDPAQVTSPSTYVPPPSRPLENHDDAHRTRQHPPPPPPPPPPPHDSEDPNDRTLTSAPSLQSPVPPNVTRYSLSDNPVALPSVVINTPSPAHSEENIPALTNGHAASPPDTPPIDAPAMANSLAALKKSDVLERRASKRFSTYNISKMTGGGGRERPAHGRSTNRRSMVADASHLTPGELDVLTKIEELPEKAVRRNGSRSKSRESSASSGRIRTPTPSPDESAPPLPPLPSASPVPEPTAPPPPLHGKSVVRLDSPDPSTSSTHSDHAEPATARPRQFTVFLQVGRVVKKVTIEPGLSFSSLRVLFVDKFSYNPGQDNFPSIYIRDPASGVMYELEDVDEVQDKCLLSLNIEPLDQIKQHIDSQMSTLAQELKEMRTTFSNARRMSHTPIIAQPFNDLNHSISRPSDTQFQRVARRLSRLVTDGAPLHSQATGGPALQLQLTGTTLQPQMTGGSVLSDTSGRIVADLKTQFDEVQHLRRDLGVMRQLYGDFMGQTKDALGALRAQTQAVRQLADAKVGGARAYIDSGKARLDARSQTVLTRIEELQDTVENLKEDVLKRYVSPKSQVFKTVTKDIAEVAAELGSLKEYMKTVKPMWKKTWEEELQNIVEEQQFLSHQEEFLNDLLEDHKALQEVFGHVEKVISIRGAGTGKVRAFRPPPPEEGSGNIDTVMMEIRSAAIDPERRMKAIAANQKNREREMANRADEFEAELGSFVSGKKLKLTGGAEEVERVRQKRSDMALKAMFNTSVGNLTPSTTDSGSMSDHDSNATA